MEDRIPRIICAKDDYRFNICTPSGELLVSLTRIEGTVRKIDLYPIIRKATITIHMPNHGYARFDIKHNERLVLGTKITLYFLDRKPVTEFNYSTTGGTTDAQD